MVAFGPSYSTVVSAGRLGRLQGESPAEAADRAARENQAQMQSKQAIALNNQRISENNVSLNRLRDAEIARRESINAAADKKVVVPTNVGTVGDKPFDPTVVSPVVRAGLDSYSDRPKSFNTQDIANVASGSLEGTGYPVSSSTNNNRINSFKTTDTAGLKTGSSTVVAEPSSASKLIESFEGFISEPEFDVNAYRVGFGSDTITKLDGTVVSVTPGMVVTREDALRDLARRTKDFAATAQRQIGADVWATLPQDAKDALTSIAYNYGSLPDRILTPDVLAGVKKGNFKKLADAVVGLRSDNDGINAARRSKEAALIRNASVTDTVVESVTDTKLTPDMVEARLKESKSFGADIRKFIFDMFDGAAGATSATATLAYGASADVLAMVASITGLTKLGAELEKNSDIAYNIALANGLKGLSYTQGMTAADFDMEPAEFKKLLITAKKDVEAYKTGDLKPSVEVQKENVVKAGLSFGDAKATSIVKQIATGAPLIQDQKIASDTKKLNSQEQALYKKLRLAGLRNDVASQVAIQLELDAVPVAREYLNGMSMLSKFNLGDDQALADWLYNNYGEGYSLQPYNNGTYTIMKDGVPADDRMVNITKDQLIVDLRGRYDLEYQASVKASSIAASERYMETFKSSLKNNEAVTKEMAQLDREKTLELIKTQYKEYDFKVVDGMAVANIPGTSQTMIVMMETVTNADGVETDEPTVTIIESNPLLMKKP